MSDESFHLPDELLSEDKNGEITETRREKCESRLIGAGKRSRSNDDDADRAHRRRREMSLGEAGFDLLREIGFLDDDYSFGPIDEGNNNDDNETDSAFENPHPFLRFDSIRSTSTPDSGISISSPELEEFVSAQYRSPDEPKHEPVLFQDQLPVAADYAVTSSGPIISAELYPPQPSWKVEPRANEQQPIVFQPVAQEPNHRRWAPILNPTTLPPTQMAPPPGKWIRPAPTRPESRSVDFSPHGFARILSDSSEDENEDQLVRPGRIPLAASRPRPISASVAHARPTTAPSDLFARARGLTGPGVILASASPLPIATKAPTRSTVPPAPRPPVPFGLLIALALKNSLHGCLPVHEIYEFVEHNFPFYRSHDQWKNSIRHNLSSNCVSHKSPTTRFFVKLEKPRRNEHSRKGNLWMLNHEKIFTIQMELENIRQLNGNRLLRSMELPEYHAKIERGIICPENLAPILKFKHLFDTQLIGKGGVKGPMITWWPANCPWTPKTSPHKTPFGKVYRKPPGRPSCRQSGAALVGSRTLESFRARATLEASQQRLTEFVRAVPSGFRFKADTAPRSEAALPPVKAMTELKVFHPAPFRMSTPAPVAAFHNVGVDAAPIIPMAVSSDKSKTGMDYRFKGDGNGAVGGAHQGDLLREAMLISGLT